MKLINTLRTIKKNFSNYRPSVEVLISRKNLIHNLNEYKEKYPEISFAPVLKSNAYGHGLIEVGRVLEKESVSFFVLDSLFEAIALREDGIKTPILVIGYTSPENIFRSRLSNVAFTVTSLEQLREISENLKKTKVFHIKIDTGMHRQGILPREIESAMEIIKSNKFISLEGVCSHLANADDADESFTKFQINQWQKAVESFRRNFENIKFFHLSATAGTYYAEQAFCNVGRLGLGLYGINASPLAKLNLKPVLQMRSVISSIKTIPEGEYVGYNNTYKTENERKIVTVPAGYFEGVDSKLSNVGFFKVGNNLCPIVGRVSMNITSIDVTGIPEVNLGDEVIVIGNNSENKNSVENIAKMANTIPYEILIHIPQHLKRAVE